MNIKETAKAYLRLSIERNKTVKSFDFSNKEKQGLSLSKFNEDFSKLYGIIYTGLNLIAKADAEDETRNLPNIFIEIMLISAKAEHVRDLLREQDFRSEKEMQKLLNCERIIDGASDFLNLSRWSFPKELSKEIIIEEANKRLPNDAQLNNENDTQLTTNEIIQKIAESEQVADNATQNDDNEYSSLIDGIREKMPSEIIAESKTNQNSFDNNQENDDQIPTIKIPQDTIKNYEE